MSAENRPSPPPALPPISMFTSMPASPPSSNYDNKKSLPILPKPPGEFYEKQQQQQQHTDQSVLWALFNQFQQQQQQLPTHKDRRASDPVSNSSSTSSTERVLTSEEVLAEKRRRNAGASARFRDRRKQREKELYERCTQLEQRAKDLENALRCFDQEHPLLLATSEPHESRQTTPTTTTTTTFTEQNTLFDRVGQLENMMARFKQEKETDVQKLDELEKENKYLRSLLVPVHQLDHKNSHKRSRSSSISEEN